jgi:surface protein
MHYMFSSYGVHSVASQFNGDISKWDVSKVTDMGYMFQNSKFNGDISKWNVSKVTRMFAMFQNSKFNGDISKWNVSNVKDMNGMFYGSQFRGDISKWKIPVETKMDFYCQMYPELKELPDDVLVKAIEKELKPEEIGKEHRGALAGKKFGF